MTLIKAEWTQDDREADQAREHMESVGRILRGIESFGHLLFHAGIKKHVGVFINKEHAAYDAHQNDANEESIKDFIHTIAFLS